MPETIDNLQAFHRLMSSYSIPAYEENSVPDSAVLPYLTYDIPTGFFNDSLSGTFSLWYRDSSWAGIIAKSNEIAADISRGGKMVTYTGGAFWIRRGSPWAQRMEEPSDDSVRRIVHNYIIEFIE